MTMVFKFKVGDLVRNSRHRWRFNQMNPHKYAVGIIVNIKESLVETEKGIWHPAPRYRVRWTSVANKHWRGQPFEREHRERNLILLSSHNSLVRGIL
jgi:hypothetical protein